MKPLNGWEVNGIKNLRKRKYLVKRLRILNSHFSNFMKQNNRKWIRVEKKHAKWLASDFKIELDERIEPQGKYFISLFLMKCY